MPSEIEAYTHDVHDTQCLERRHGLKYGEEGNCSGSWEEDVEDPEGYAAEGHVARLDVGRSVVVEHDTVDEGSYNCTCVKWLDA